MEKMDTQMRRQGTLNIFSEDYYQPGPQSSMRRPHTSNTDRLIHAACGITSDGLRDQPESRPHIHPGRYQRATEAEYRGKRHIDPAYTNISDEAKRAEGRLGKAHVRTTPQSRGATTFSLSADDACDSAEAPPPPRAHAHAHSKTTSTSMQLSEARLRNIAQSHPRYAAPALSLLRDFRGDAHIVGAEEKLSRRIASELYAAGSRERCAAQSAEADRRAAGAARVGRPSAAIRAGVPFALDASAPRADTQRAGRGAHDPNAESAPAPEAPRRHVDGRQLADHIQFARNAYPDPPPVGVREKPRGVRKGGAAQRESTECADEVMMRRARGRCHRGGAAEFAHGNREERDFIFGTEPPPPAPALTLREKTEARWKAQDERDAERHRGRAMTHQSHKRTALW